MAAKFVSNIRKGDKLCRLRTIPMSSKLILKVKNIYKKCQSIDTYWGDTPLILASRFGLANMVWGFIECAKKTQTNLHTGETGELQKFLWLRNRDHQTALDVAIAKNHVEVAKLLLVNASLECLISERNWRGKLPVSMLSDHQHDGFIFDILEKAKRAEADPPASTLVPIDDKQQESKVYEDNIMDPNSYPMLQRNETRKFLDELVNGQLKLSPKKNTILHLVSKLGDVKYVKDILEKHPSLIDHRNSEGETPAYVAARDGHLDVLAMMINHFKSKDHDIELMVTRKKDKHTALHIAIQNHHVGVVFWLIKEVPLLANHINHVGESSLFLVAERGYDEILNLMLNKCEEKAFEGPNGKTALHAAAISGSTDCIEHLLSAKVDILHVQDKHGWTPLRYAVHYNHSLATQKLLEKDPSIQYQIMTEDDINTSLIHIAASQSHCETMEVLLSKCPGCADITDSKGRNILHDAVENKRTKVIEFIFGDESLTSLINEKDSDGNTPIHLFMASDLEMMEMVMDSRIDINVLNNEKLTPLDMTSSDEKRERLVKAIVMGRRGHNETSALSSSLEKGDSNQNKLEENGDSNQNVLEEKGDSNKNKLEEVFKFEESLLLVATLITTATFAAAFTVPGGFDGNQGSKQGMPVLLRKSAFQAFVVTNTIAFCCSCSVLFGHIALLIRRIVYDEDDNKESKHIGKRIFVMHVLTGFAMLAMAVAFVTGIYVVLTPSLGLAIFLCVMSLFIMGSMVVFPVKIVDMFIHSDE